jgi:molybdopterin/thiamine biosynthesis adenylyltransferase
MSQSRKFVDIARNEVAMRSKTILEKLMHESSSIGTNTPTTVNNDYAIADDYQLQMTDNVAKQTLGAPPTHEVNKTLHVVAWEGKGKALSTQATFRTLTNTVPVYRQCSVTYGSPISAPLCVTAYLRHTSSDLRAVVDNHTAISAKMGPLAKAFASTNPTGTLARTHPDAVHSIPLHLRKEGAYVLQACTVTTARYTLDKDLEITHSSVVHNLDVNNNRFVAECVTIQHRNGGPCTTIVATSHPTLAHPQDNKPQILCNLLGLDSHIVGQSQSNSLAENSSVLPPVVGITQTAMTVRALRRNTQNGSMDPNVYEPLRTDPYLQNAHVIPLSSNAGFNVTLLRTAGPVESGPRRDLVFVHTRIQFPYDSPPETMPQRTLNPPPTLADAIAPTTKEALVRKEAGPPLKHQRDLKPTISKREVLQQKKATAPILTPPKETSHNEAKSNNLSRKPPSDSLSALFTDIDPYMAPPGSSLHLMNMLDDMVRAQIP